MIDKIVLLLLYINNFICSGFKSFSSPSSSLAYYDNVSKFSTMDLEALPNSNQFLVFYNLYLIFF